MKALESYRITRIYIEKGNEVGVGAGSWSQFVMRWVIIRVYDWMLWRSSNDANPLPIYEKLDRIIYNVNQQDLELIDALIMKH